MVGQSNFEIQCQFQIQFNSKIAAHLEHGGPGVPVALLLGAGGLHVAAMHGGDGDEGDVRLQVVTAALEEGRQALHDLVVPGCTHIGNREYASSGN